MSITKEQIREWVEENTLDDKAGSENTADLIYHCMQDLAPKWVSVDEITPEDDNVFYWVKLENGYIELIRLNKYTAIGGRKDYWQDLNGNDFDMKGSHYIDITPPK